MLLDFRQRRRRSGSARRAAGRWISASARPRWRLPPTTSSASATSRRATGERPSTPSSPMPTMDSQRLRLATHGHGPASVAAHPRRHDGSLGAGAHGSPDDARLRADAVAGRPHDQPTAAADSRRASAASAASTGSSTFLARRSDRRRGRRHASLCRPDVRQCRRGLQARPACRSPRWCVPHGSAQAGDRWQVVANTEAAAHALGQRAAPCLPEPRPAGAARLRRERRSTTISRALIEPPDQTTLPPDLQPAAGARPVRSGRRRAPAARASASTSWSRKNAGGTRDLRQDRGGARARPAGRHDRAAAQAGRPVVDGRRRGLAWPGFTALPLARGV